MYAIEPDTLGGRRTSRLPDTAGGRPNSAAGCPWCEVQHHHAHVASVMAEHGLDGSSPVIGFRLRRHRLRHGRRRRAPGLGRRGAGGRLSRVRARRPSPATLPLPGGDEAVRNPCRIAVAYLTALGVGLDRGLPAVAACDRGGARRGAPSGGTRHRVRSHHEHGAALRRRQLAPRDVATGSPTRRRQPSSSRRLAGGGTVDASGAPSWTFGAGDGRRHRPRTRRAGAGPPICRPGVPAPRSGARFHRAVAGRGGRSADRPRRRSRPHAGRTDRWRVPERPADRAGPGRSRARRLRRC